MRRKTLAKKSTDFLTNLMDEFGADVVEMEESAETIKKLKVIKTGSTSMDVSLGVGGIPRGRITTVYGPESSAKTTLALSIAKGAIADGLKVLYVDPENALDHAYIRAIVGDFDKDMFILAQPETAESTFKICEQGINSGEIGLIVLDSIGALAPEKEKEDEFEKASIGVIPRMLSKFLRRNAYSIKDKEIAFLIINQVRAVVGAYIPTLEMPGGNALRHFSSIIIYLHRSELIKFGEEVVGAQSKYTVKKNKVGKPFRTFTFPMFYGTGINKARDTLEFSVPLGIVLKKASYYYYKDILLGQGIVKAEDFLNEHPEVLDKIAEECYNISNRTKERSELSEQETVDS
jgi:recombination protein RecA